MNLRMVDLEPQEAWIEPSVQEDVSALAWNSIYMGLHLMDDKSSEQRMIMDVWDGPEWDDAWGDERGHSDTSA